MHENTLKISTKTKSLTAVLGIAASILLPQLFHFIGITSGHGASLGAAFLPMHLPVFIAGFIAGPLVGFAVGAISPLLSFAISGMPTLFVLPFMMIELAVYGLTCGLLKNGKLPVICKLLIAGVLGRLARAGALFIAVYAFSYSALPISSILVSVKEGLPGIVLQLVLIPLIMYRMGGTQKRGK